MGAAAPAACIILTRSYNLTRLALVLLTLAWSCKQTLALASDSYCSNPSRQGIGPCNEDIFLKGQFVQAGTNQAGSFGTVSDAPAAFAASTLSDKRAGIIADYGKDGWGTGSPKFAGDFFLPGSPFEGWTVQANFGFSTTTSVNRGLMDPPESGVTPSAAHITSDSDRQSMFWVGQDSNLQVRFNLVIGNADLSMASTVVLKNMKSTPLTDVYYMKIIDPDQGYPLTSSYNTLNWVKYQPFAPGDLPGYVDDDDPNLALVLARSVENGQLLCAMGTSHPRARVAMTSYSTTGPADALSSSDWKSWGGKNVGPSDTTSMQNADAAISLIFYFPSLDPGATAEFDLVYILEANDFDTPLDTLKAVKIAQPTDIISGANALISIQLSDGIGPITQISLWLYGIQVGDSSPLWQSLGAFSYESPENKDRVFSMMVDTTSFKESQDVQLKVVVCDNFECNADQQYAKLKPLALNNNPNAPFMCFDVADAVNVEFDTITPRSLGLTRCAGYVGGLPSTVQFYREAYVGGNLISERLGIDANANDGFTWSVSTDNFAEGTHVYVKAKCTRGSDTTAATVAGVVTSNAAPSLITLSNAIALENSAIGATVGTFSVTDSNTADTHTLELIDDAGGMFALDGFKLVVNGEIDFEAVPAYQVNVRANDGHYFRCCSAQTFTITVQNVNEPPLAVQLTCAGTPRCFVFENSPINTVVGTLSAADEDDGQAHMFSVVDDSPFGVAGDKLIVADHIKYNEAQTSTQVTVKVTDSGSPPQSLTVTFTILVLPTVAPVATVSSFPRWFQATAQPNMQFSDGLKVQCPQGCSVAAWGDEWSGGGDIPEELLSPAVGSEVVLLAASVRAFAALKADGSVVAWGYPANGGANVPEAASNPAQGAEVIAIASTQAAFAALKADGTVTAWGDDDSGGSAPGNVESGPAVMVIASTQSAFAAIRIDGSLVAWGNPSDGGFLPPAIDDSPPLVKAMSIASTTVAFATLRADGFVVAWGNAAGGGGSVPAAVSDPQSSGAVEVVAIASTATAFAALAVDGSVWVWGDANAGGSGVPSVLSNPGAGIEVIAATERAFAARSSTGSLFAWGAPGYGGSGAPGGINAVAISSTRSAFAAITDSGALVTWGDSENGGDATAVPSNIEVVAIASTATAFAARTAEGSVAVWGSQLAGGSTVDPVANVLVIASTESAFAALMATGSVSAWGEHGGSNVPVSVTNPMPGGEVVAIATTKNAFAALKRIPCPSNTYAIITETSAVCEPCPAGKYSSSVGASSSAVCIPPEHSRMHVKLSSDDKLPLRVDDEQDDTTYFFIDQLGRVRVNSNVYDTATETLVVNGPSRLNGDVFLNDNGITLVEEMNAKVRGLPSSVGMLTQNGKVRLDWVADRWDNTEQWLYRFVALDISVASGTEVVLLTVTDLHHQTNPSTLPHVWFTGPELSDSNADEVVGFTVRVVMGADAALLGDQTEVAEVGWTVIGKRYS